MVRAKNVVDNLRVNDFIFTNRITGPATNNSAASGTQIISLNETFSSYITNNVGQLNASLADGIEGQIKIIKLATHDTSNMVVTPANFADGTNITFDATGEVAILLFDGTNWQEIYTDATVA